MKLLSASATIVLASILLAGCANQTDSEMLGTWKAEQAKAVAGKDHILGILSANVSKGSGEQSSITLGLQAKQPARSLEFTCYGSGVMNGLVHLKVNGHQKKFPAKSLQCGKPPIRLKIDARTLASSTSLEFQVVSSNAESAWQLVAKEQE